jgi:hypothetical protein
MHIHSLLVLGDISSYCNTLSNYRTELRAVCFSYLVIDLHGKRKMKANNIVSAVPLQSYQQHAPSILFREFTSVSIQYL